MGAMWVGRTLAVAMLPAVVAVGVLTASADPGDLDPGFAGDGVATTVIGDAAEGRAVAVQADGRLLVAGSAEVGGDLDVAVARYTTAGTLDPTWGGDGLVTVDVGGEDDLVYGLLVQSDGKVVAVGASATDPMGLSFDFLAVRLTSSGALDLTFGGTGWVTVGIGPSSDYAQSAVATPSNQLVLAGYASNGTDWDVGVARLTADGDLDTGFAGDGTVLVPVGSGDDHGYAVDRAGDGGLVVAGASVGDVAVVRLTASGALDTAWGGDGVVTVDLGAGDDAGAAVDLAPDGDVVVAGTSGGDVAVVRLTASGALDAAWGGTGAVTVAVGSGDDAGRAVAVASDGRVVVAGSSHNGADDDAAVLRFTAAGALDAGFSGNGSLTVGVSGDDVAHGLALAADGRILLGGESAGRFLAVAVEGATVPDVPTGLVAVAGDGAVGLSWSAPGDDGGAAVTGYVVEVSADGGATWSASSSPSSTAATVDGLVNGGAYRFRVSAVNGVGTGDPSDTAVATPVGPPDVPIGLAVVAGDGAVGLSWSAPGDDGGAAVTGYVVEVSADGGATWSASSSPSSTAATVDGLVNGGAYRFRVSAVNGVGTGDPSDTAAAVPFTVPAAPAGLVAGATDRAVDLSWTAPADDGGRAVTGYTVQRSVDGGDHWTTIVADTGSSATTHTVTGLVNGVPHAFRVAAVNTAGTGSPSALAEATPATVPDAPTGLTAAAGDGSVVLTWQAPAAGGGRVVIGYRIEVSTDGGVHWTVLVADTGSPETARLVDGLANGLTHWFRVAAANAMGVGPASATASARPWSAGPVITVPVVPLPIGPDPDGDQSGDVGQDSGIPPRPIWIG